MVNPDSAAFPTFENNEWGLTKREYFAAMALQGLLANSDLTGSMDSADEEFGRGIANWQVKRAVRCADLLIKELNANEQ